MLLNQSFLLEKLLGFFEIQALPFASRMHHLISRYQEDHKEFKDILCRYLLQRILQLATNYFHSLMPIRLNLCFKIWRLPFVTNTLYSHIIDLVFCQLFRRFCFHSAMYLPEIPNNLLPANSSLILCRSHLNSTKELLRVLLTQSGQLQPVIFGRCRLLMNIFLCLFDYLLTVLHGKCSLLLYGLIWMATWRLLKTIFS